MCVERAVGTPGPPSSIVIFSMAGTGDRERADSPGSYLRMKLGGETRALTRYSRPAVSEGRRRRRPVWAEDVSPTKGSGSQGCAVQTEVWRMSGIHAGRGRRGAPTRCGMRGGPAAPTCSSNTDPTSKRKSCTEDAVGLGLEDKLSLAREVTPHREQARSCIFYLLNTKGT